MGGVPHGGGGASQNLAWGKGLGLGRRPDPCLLVPNAPRQEAEANFEGVTDPASCTFPSSEEVFLCDFTPSMSMVRSLVCWSW